MDVGRNRRHRQHHFDMYIHRIQEPLESRRYSMAEFLEMAVVRRIEVRFQLDTAVNRQQYLNDELMMDEEVQLNHIQNNQGGARPDELLPVAVALDNQEFVAADVHHQLPDAAAPEDAVPVAAGLRIELLDAAAPEDAVPVAAGLRNKLLAAIAPNEALAAEELTNNINYYENEVLTEEEPEEQAWIQAFTQGMIFQDQPAPEGTDPYRLCLENKTKVIFCPCGHLSLCLECRYKFEASIQRRNLLPMNNAPLICFICQAESFIYSIDGNL
ncbi:uncharacterized protein LOC130666891 [Microplitis mediator]|uniref:uncharacterized protein LOC130666891 n=1 Tax=Microplitis mediator TaxID=375433 RepID=UPI002552FD24|nr:uncharacterized protein LOC130666891 [Microplitis mediator]